MLNLQLTIGYAAQTLWYGCLLALVPFIVVLFVLLIRKKFRTLKRFSFFLAVIYLLAFLLCKVFSSVPYEVAKQIGVYIPWSVQTLEEEHDYGGFPIDDFNDYYVIHFNSSQMCDFVKVISSNSKWKRGEIIPSQLFSKDSYQREEYFASKKHPFPNSIREGYYYSASYRVNKKFDYCTDKTIYFLDLKSNTLYVYHDYGQWG